MYIPKTPTALAAFLVSTDAYAAVYSGGGICDGITQAEGIVGSGSLRDKVIAIVAEVLSYMALAAVVMIVIAGIRLVISQGEEDQKEKAKRTIIYAVIGLIIILLARGLVQLAINTVAPATTTP